MLKDIDIYWQPDWNPQEHTDNDRTQYGVYAIVVDNEVADVCAYKKSFIDLYNNNTFVETGFDGTTYTIDVVNADNLVVETLELSDQMGSLFLSEPITVKVLAENRYASVGLAYVNGEIIRP
jgi:CYTH domain-containing protein